MSVKTWHATQHFACWPVCVFMLMWGVYVEHLSERNMFRTNIIEKYGTYVPNIHSKVTDFEISKETVTRPSKTLRYASFTVLRLCRSFHRWLNLQLYLFVQIWSSWANWDCNIRSSSRRYFFRCCCNLQVWDCTTHSQFSCTCYRFEYPQVCLTIKLLWKVQGCSHLHQVWTYKLNCPWHMRTSPLLLWCFSALPLQQ